MTNTNFVAARPGGNTGGATGGELEAIQDRYMNCLRAYTQHMCPQQPNRYHELLVRLPEVSQLMNDLKFGFDERCVAGTIGSCPFTREQDVLCSFLIELCNPEIVQMLNYSAYP